MLDSGQVEQVFRRVNAEHIRTWMADDNPLFQPTFDYAVSRFREGQQLLRMVLEDYPGIVERHPKLLDVGGGNGGIVLPFAQHGAFECHTFDLFHHRELRLVLARTALPLEVAIARGEGLPYKSESFRLVLYVETMEHVANARRVGREIARVLEPGGLCLVTTPPRLPFLLKPDPHYHLKGLLLLPNFAQRWLVERAFRRGTKYEVTHIYWSALGLLRDLPGLRLDRVFSARAGRLSRCLNWSLVAARKP